MIRAAIILILSAGTASALSLEAGKHPAETPPASYKGQTYVDSRGCVYVRAGFGGQVTWVPRVGADRKVICGVKPTFAPAPTIPAETDTAVAAAPSPKPVAAPQPAPAPSSMSPKNEPQEETAAAPAPTRRRVVQSAPPNPAPAAAASATRRVPAKTSETTVEASQSIHAACTRSSNTALVHVGGRDLRLRCPEGMKTARNLVVAVGGTHFRVVLVPPPPLTYAAGANADGVPVRRGRSADAAQRRLPGAGAAVRTAAAPLAPSGYKLAWNDDRLNPNRGRGTAAGRRMMQLIWTDTVPRRLVDAKTGADMTARYSHLYPLNDAGDATGTSAVVMSTKSVAAAAAARRAAAPARPEASTGAAASHRFVQVGTFGVPDNAQSTARKLMALGLPAQIGKTARHQIVVAGPFKTQAELTAALATVRRAGFRDAFPKN